MQNLILFPNRQCVIATGGFEVTHERFSPAEFEYFYVEDGPAKLMGKRFKGVYVHWLCYDEPRYNDCVMVILSAIAFAKEPIASVLFC